MYSSWEASDVKRRQGPSSANAVLRSLWASLQCIGNRGTGNDSSCSRDSLEDLASLEDGSVGRAGGNEEGEDEAGEFHGSVGRWIS